MLIIPTWVHITTGLSTIKILLKHIRLGWLNTLNTNNYIKKVEYCLFPWIPSHDRIPLSLKSFVYRLYDYFVYQTYCLRIHSKLQFTVHIFPNIIYSSLIKIRSCVYSSVWSNIASSNHFPFQYLSNIFFQRLNCGNIKGKVFVYRNKYIFSKCQCKLYRPDNICIYLTEKCQ